LLFVALIYPLASPLPRTISPARYRNYKTGVAYSDTLLHDDRPHQPLAYVTNRVDNTVSAIDTTSGGPQFG
jgi:hypothetical protein